MIALVPNSPILQVTIQPRVTSSVSQYCINVNFIALYHMGIYANPDLLNWFLAEYPKHCTSKLDMEKAIRFKKIDQIYII
jgi:hypothetical protein